MVDQALGELTPELLQKALQITFPSRDSELLGEWELRYTPALEGTYSSVRVCGSPETRLDGALARIRNWYASRGAQPLLQAVEPCPFDPEFKRLGWKVSHAASVMTAATPRPTLSPPHGGLAWSRRSDVSLDSVQDDVATATVWIDGHVAGVGKMTLISDAPTPRPFAALHEMKTQEPFRRQGVATRLLSELESWSVALGARAMALHLLDGNQPARALYEANGFAVHHRYRYWVEEPA